uniref:DOMON domain-containing protein n=1 Tax=Spongospora subterranea TaxID=70186 RepID=A0A0H5R7J0_9EUKA|eukprot:CRZ10120.1 hypothetical protein [Spongospora subterranea]
MMKTQCLAIILVLALSANYGQAINGTLASPNKEWHVMWEVNTANATIDFTVWAKTTGWVGLGLSYDGPSGHKNSDVMVGFLTNNTLFLYDQFSNNHRQPELDTTLGGVDNLNLLDGGLIDNGIWYKFRRALDTKDGTRDVVIEKKDIYVAWAYGSDVPTFIDGGKIDYNIHPDGQFGAVKTNLFEAQTLPPTGTAKQTTSKKTTKKATTVATTAPTKSSASTVSSYVALVLAAIAIVFQ